jgi:hypothetical protein
MKRDTRVNAGDSKSNVSAQQAAKTARRQQQSPAVQRLDASPSVTSFGSVSASARYIDSRMKQFCLR